MNTKNAIIVYEDNMLYWTNLNGELSVDEVERVVAYIKSVVEQYPVDALIVDNSSLRYAWSSDIDRIWIDLLKYSSEHIPKTATLCQNIISKVQLDYLAEQSGISDNSKTFTLNERGEFEHFIHHDEEE